ncbi:MAG TPA: hypothetical protein VGE74_19445 [Gemmata sp.]
MPPIGPALPCWPAQPWSFVTVYNARQGSAAEAPPGYPLDPKALAPSVLRAPLTTAIAQAPIAVRELLIHELGDCSDIQPAFARPLYCPFTGRV